MNKQQLAQKIWASANQMRSKIENVVIVVYNDNTGNEKGGLYGDKN